MKPLTLAFWIFVGATFAPSSPGAEAPPAVGNPAYALRLGNDGLLVAEDGKPVPAADVPAYLKKLGITEGTAFLLLFENGSDAIKSATPTVKAIGESGLTKVIMFKALEPADKLGPFFLPPAKPPQQVVAEAFPGERFPSADLSKGIPALLELRAVEIRPGSVPPNVKYAYSENSEMAASASRLVERFITGTPAGQGFWANAVKIEAGAWRILKSDDGLGKRMAIPIQSRPGTGAGPTNTSSILLQDRTELATLDRRIKAMVAEDGGGKVRALRADEMAAWWSFISYDIVEPILVLETAKGTHRLVFGFNRRGAAMLDDLSQLEALRAEATGK